jgi:hypothetical protein
MPGMTFELHVQRKSNRAVAEYLLDDLGSVPFEMQHRSRVPHVVNADVRQTGILHADLARRLKVR